MHAGVVQSSGLHVKGSARGGTASSSGRSWAHACLSGSGRSCYSGPCREPDIGSLRLNRRQPAACSLRARDIAHPASALHQLSSECRRGAFGRNPSKCSQQRSRERHHAACAAAGAGGRLGGTWQPQHPGPGDRGPSGRPHLHVPVFQSAASKSFRQIEAWSLSLVAQACAARHNRSCPGMAQAGGHG